MRIKCIYSESKKKKVLTHLVVWDIFMETDDTLIKSLSINSSLRTKVMCVISNNELYNNDTGDIKI